MMMKSTPTAELHHLTRSPQSVADLAVRFRSEAVDRLTPLALLALRLPVAAVFWRSGHT